MALGAMTGIMDIAKTIRELDAVNKIDCRLMSKGVYANAFDPAGVPGASSGPKEAADLLEHEIAGK